MKFTNIRLEKVEETPVGEIYKGLSYNFYDLKPSCLSEKEENFASVLGGIIERKKALSELDSFDFLPEDFKDSFRDEIITNIEIEGLLEKIPSAKIFLQLFESLLRLISKIDFISNKSFFCEKVLHDSIGLKKLSFFSLEKDFEELMVNSLNEIFVYHKKFGLCRTNLVLGEKTFNNLIQRIANSVGQKFDSSNPLLDARLPDGSRVNATFDNVSPKSISLTIRKFSVTPLSIVDLLENNTLSSSSAAFLWMMVDGFGVNPKNILVVGGSASGKTTMLCILSNFIRLSERIISIEDTLELSFLERDNWVALESKKSFDERVEMIDLLKNSLRMRPDRLIVGEIRGSEANAFFTAMDTGQAGCMGTVHANNAREAVDKLREKPFDVPPVLLPLVDIVVVMKKYFSKKEGVSRKISQISEVSKMDGKILISNVFETVDGSLERTNYPSHVFEKFAEENSMEKNDLKKEINTRKLILEWMLSKKINNPREILEIIQSYYFNPEKVLSVVYDTFEK